MPFTGFNVKYPEYEVITPQTKLSFTVRSLNVQEEERLKGSLMTPSKVTEHLNKCLFDSIVTRPDSIPDYNTFLRTVTLKDRDALLYGLYHITYEEIRNYEIKCGSCGHKYPVTVKASSTFNFKPFEGDNILSKRKDIKLPISKGVIAVVKQPSLFDEMTAVKELSSRPGSSIDIIIETLIIDSFKDTGKDSEDVIYNERVDIVDAYMSLPAKDKREIHKIWLDEFGQYGIELKMKTYCPQCSTEEEIDIDLVDNFFRAVYSA